MVNNKTFENRPIKELMAIVRQDLRQLDDQGLVDEGTVIKTIMYCNDKLGIPLREVKTVCIPVVEYRAKLPLNFEKLYFMAATRATGTIQFENQRNPFDNSFDSDVIYEADLDRESLGHTEHYNVTIKRETGITIQNTASWVSLSLGAGWTDQCHISCPNLRKPGKYQVDFIDDELATPFRSGELFLVYIATMQDLEGNLLFPFHPVITPYYEWAIKEKILMDAVFNSDGNYGDLLELAKRERGLAWLDAWNITLEKGYGEYVEAQRKKELQWYNQWFKYFQ